MLKAAIPLFCNPLGILLLASLPLHAMAKQNNGAPVNLLIKPKLCIISEKELSCQDEILIDWETEVDISVCLFLKSIKTPLRCWTQKQDGLYYYSVDAKESITFQLREKIDNELLISAVFEVLKEQANYRRRRRNPWAFF